MESKVIEDLLNNKLDVLYEPQLSFKKEEGSGNNWGYGFYHHGKTSFEEIHKKFLKLSEKMDFIENIIFI